MAHCRDLEMSRAPFRQRVLDPPASVVCETTSCFKQKTGEQLAREYIALLITTGGLTSIIVAGCSTSSLPSTPSGLARTDGVQELRVADVGGGGATTCLEVTEDCVEGTLQLTAGGGSISGVYKAPATVPLGIGSDGGTQSLTGIGRFAGIRPAAASQILAVGLRSDARTALVRLLFYLPPSSQEFWVTSRLDQAYRSAEDTSCRSGYRQFYTLTGAIPQLGLTEIRLTHCQP